MYSPDANVGDAIRNEQEHGMPGLLSLFPSTITPKGLSLTPFLPDALPQLDQPCEQVLYLPTWRSAGIAVHSPGTLLLPHDMAAYIDKTTWRASERANVGAAMEREDISVSFPCSPPTAVARRMLHPPTCPPAAAWHLQCAKGAQEAHRDQLALNNWNC